MYKIIANKEQLGDLETIKRSPVYRDEINKKIALEFYSRIGEIDKENLDESLTKLFHEVFNIKL